MAKSGNVIISKNNVNIGEVAEWLNARLSKSRKGASSSGVQISPSPQIICAIISQMIEYYLGLMWGVIIGFAVAVPVGPVGLICIQKTITQSRISGLIPGLGAAIADVLLASVGAFSINVIFSFITKEQVMLRVVGSLFLLTLGIFALIKVRNQKKDPDPKVKVKKETTLSLVDEFLSGFVLTITNPLTAFFFFLAFANISDTIGDSLQVAITFVVGIFIGSCLWWLLLTSVTDRIAHKIKHEHIRIMNKWFAIILMVIGAFMSVSVLF